jgi:hypothetical protein
VEVKKMKRFNSLLEYKEFVTVRLREAFKKSENDEEKELLSNLTQLAESLTNPYDLQYFFISLAGLQEWLEEKGLAAIIPTLPEMRSLEQEARKRK